MKKVIKMKNKLLILLLLTPMLFQIKEVRYKNHFQGFKLNFNDVIASTLLTGNPVFTTDLDKANYVRYYYYTVNGAAAGYSLYNKDSYIDQVNSFTQGVGTAMAARGYATCADIPTSGTFQEMMFNGTYAEGDKVIPANFPNDAGETYDKKLILKVNGSTLMEIQLKCSSGSLISGYVLSGNQEMTEGTMNEIMFQMDESDGLVYIDYVLKVDNDRNFVTRFSTDDGINYKLYTMFSWYTSFNGVAINGEANGKTNMNILYSRATGNDVYNATAHDISGIANDPNQEVYNVCLDMDSNSSTTGCDAIEDAGSITVNGNSYTFSFNSFSTLTTSSHE